MKEFGLKNNKDFTGSLEGMQKLNEDNKSFTKNLKRMKEFGLKQ